jgi:ABC-type multidrug transport system ATPase subunit
MKAVSATHLFKSYGSKKERVQALNDVSFDTSEGELFGIIGPDGAGKTSLFRILTTLLLADKGEVKIDGFDVVSDYRQIRQRVGYMPGRFSLYQDLTVAENLEFFARIFNTSIKENYDLIKEIYRQIEPFSNRRAGKLSGGMKQKLALCCALIHRPSVLFLDEPTTGVDAVSRKEFWEMLNDLRNEGITILVSTPYMDEAGLCDRVALMQAGEIMSLDTPDAITRRFGRPLFAVKAPAMYPLLLALQRFPGAENAYAFGEYHHTTLKKGFGEADLTAFLKRENIAGAVIMPAKAGIEDCFISLMKA